MTGRGHHDPVDLVTTRPGSRTRTADRPCIDGFEPSPAAAKPTWRLPRGVAFVLICFGVGVSVRGSALPAPVYVISQVQWHFSTSLITLIFATYAVSVLAALLFAGPLSDQVGRRPVLAAAIGLSIVSAVTFILAPGVGWLFAGRVLSGLSAGLMTGTATAALTEMARTGSGRRASLVSTTANIGGLGLGPLLAGLLAQHAPEPTVLPYLVQLGLVALAGLGLLVVPETVSERPALSLMFRGVGIPRAGRAEFVAAGLAAFAAFSLLGLFSALAPTFLAGVLHDTSHALAGAVVFLAFAASTGSQLASSRLPSRPVMLAGLAVVLAALRLIGAGLGASPGGGAVFARPIPPRCRCGLTPQPWRASLDTGRSSWLAGGARHAKRSVTVSLRASPGGLSRCAVALPGEIHDGRGAELLRDHGQGPAWGPAVRRRGPRYREGRRGQETDEMGQLLPLPGRILRAAAGRGGDVPGSDHASCRRRGNY